MPEQDLQRVFAQYRKELCGYITHRVGLSDAQAEDVVQTAFVKLANENVARIKNPRAYLYKACLNLAIDSQRRVAVRQRYVDTVVESGPSAMNDCGPARSAESSEQLQLVTNTLKDMPLKRRKLLLMHKVDGLSYAEIARRVKLSETVVRKHIVKALLECQRVLNDELNG